jgi:DNA repair protein RecN (Recombination protein N)
MLSDLHIENIAIIEKLDIGFDRGFHVLTGETGAGKSIIIDAINMVLGERASRDLVRSGAGKAFVSALFCGMPPAVLLALEPMGIFAGEDGTLLLERELSSDGRSACRINGRPVGLAALKEAGRSLVNIHGQHDSQALLQPEKHILSLTGLPQQGDSGLVHTSLPRILEIRREISELEQGEEKKKRLADLLAYQVDEIERARLVPGEEEELAARRAALSNAEKIMGAVYECLAVLCDGAEGLPPAQELLSSAAAALSRWRGSTGISPRREKSSGYEISARGLRRAFAGRGRRPEFQPRAPGRGRGEAGRDLPAEAEIRGPIDEVLEACEKARAELEGISAAGERKGQLYAELREKTESLGSSPLF